MRGGDVVIGIRYRYGRGRAVVHLRSAPTVAAGLQRVGRAGHQVGELSVGWFFPLHRADVVDATVVTERMMAGRSGRFRSANPLDILLHTIAAAAMDELVDGRGWNWCVGPHHSPHCHWMFMPRC